MKVNVENLENNVVKLDIEVNAETASQEYNKACRKISEFVNIPGFRRGKAPRAVVEKFVGVDKIQREALERLLPNVYADIISEHQFEPVSEPVIESYNYELGKPLTLVAKLELKPEVKLSKYSGLEVEIPEFKHPEGSLEKELNLLSEKFATLEPVIDRETNSNDLVVMDFTGSVDGEVIKGGTAKNYQLDLANSTFIPGFAEQLIGKKIGEEFTINVKFPDEYHDDALKGKNAEFQIKINEIKQKIVPELNDDLAKKVGAFETMDDLRTDISSYLQKAQESENKNRAQKAIIEKIIDQSEVELPDSMINREAKALMEEVQNKMKMQGIAWEQVLDQQGHENMWNNLREEATKRVKNSLVLNAIAKAESIQINDMDFAKKVEEMAVMYKTDEKTIYRQLAQNPEFVNVISQQILGQNIATYLTENNTVKFVEEKS